MIDSHIHLDADQYDDRSELIKRAHATGVEAILAPGTGPGSNQAVIDLARRFPGVVHAAVGFHPERFDLSDDDLARTLRLIESAKSRIAAVGEVGLPWYGRSAGSPQILDRARKTLRAFAAIARRTGLALILHAPHQRASEALEILMAQGVDRAVFHWHKSDPATTRAIVAAGFFISVTPEVVYRDRDRELVRMTPLERLMVETDGPWPYRGPLAGKRTEPAMVAEAITGIASVKEVSIDLVDRVTTSNARELFGIGRDP